MRDIFWCQNEYLLCKTEVQLSGSELKAAHAHRHHTHEYYELKAGLLDMQENRPDIQKNKYSQTDSRNLY